MPRTGGDSTRDGSGSTGAGGIQPSPESSGTMRPEGAIIMKSEPGGGSDQRSDSGETSPGIGAAGGSDFGTGSGSGSAGSTGSTDSSGGVGTGSGKGSASGMGGGGK